MFEYFPKTLYKIDGINYQIPTNILVRVNVIQETLSNIFNYYEYDIKDGETPEILAEKFYDDATAHWLILLTNQILDPQYDWPLDNRTFQQYIADKYGSVETAQTQYKSWWKVVETKDLNGSDVVQHRYNLSEEEYNDSVLPVDGGNTLIHDFLDGGRVSIIEYKTRINAYDWEVEENEKKRTIKLIKPEYYSEIKSQLLNILGNDDSILRRFKK